MRKTHLTTAMIGMSLGMVLTIAGGSALRALSLPWNWFEDTETGTEEAERKPVVETEEFLYDETKTTPETQTDTYEETYRKPVIETEEFLYDETETIRGTQTDTYQEETGIYGGTQNNTDTPYTTQTTEQTSDANTGTIHDYSTGMPGAMTWEDILHFYTQHTGHAWTNTPSNTTAPSQLDVGAILGAQGGGQYIR